MPATLRDQFRQAYRDLELFPLLTAEEIEAFRIEYGRDTLAKLEQAVDDGDDDSKIIFSGHRGCGKSTLLARFARQMRDLGYFVVLFSIADMVEMSAVDHINILYAIAVQLLSKATKRQVPLSPEKVQEVLTWLSTTRTETTERSLGQELGVGGDVLKLITAKLKSEATFREEITHTYERRVSDLVAKIDEIAQAIRMATKKRVLVVIDDLDKLDLKLVEEVYKNNINALFQPRLQIIFTIPISVIRDIELRTILQTASGSPIQQMEVTKFFHKAERHQADAQPDEAKVARLLEVLTKRFPNPDLIQPETARQMVLYSGGVMRELVRIARACCAQCLLLIRQEPERTELQIDGQILMLALRELRNDFAMALGSSRYDILVKTYRDAQPADLTEEFLMLLHGLYVLEYRNDEVWYDVHPIVVELLRRGNLIEV